MGETVSAIPQEQMGDSRRLDRVELIYTISEVWRYSGPFTRWNRFKGSFPGLGIATVAFAAYCGYEYLFLNDEHHGEVHGEGHH